MLKGYLPALCQESPTVDSTNVGRKYTPVRHVTLWESGESYNKFNQHIRDIRMGQDWRMRESKGEKRKLKTTWLH